MNNLIVLQSHFPVIRDLIGAKLDGLAKSRKCILSVIPAKAGIQCSQEVTTSWTPFFNGVTTFYEIIKLEDR
jgi:hypothetical protein